MPDVLKINGKIEYIFDERDFEYLINKHCDEDLAKSIMEYIKTLKDEKESADLGLDSDLRFYEASLDEYNSMCCDIRDVLKRLMEYVSEAKRLDRDKIYERLGYILKAVDDVN